MVAAIVALSRVVPTALPPLPPLVGIGASRSRRVVAAVQHRGVRRLLLRIHHAHALVLLLLEAVAVVPTPSALEMSAVPSSSEVPAAAAVVRPSVAPGLTLLPSDLLKLLRRQRLHAVARSGIHVRLHRRAVSWRPRRPLGSRTPTKTRSHALLLQRLAGLLLLARERRLKLRRQIRVESATLLPIAPATAAAAAVAAAIGGARSIRVDSPLHRELEAVLLDLVAVVPPSHFVQIKVEVVGALGLPVPPRCFHHSLEIHLEELAVAQAQKFLVLVRRHARLSWKLDGLPRLRQRRKGRVLVLSRSNVRHPDGSRSGVGMHHGRESVHLGLAALELRVRVRGDDRRGGREMRA
mmetsp:Transcript_7995/g.20525  ORF Transcript_7995/g.20525 Transcript_7995/m.20525 type:complete len:352 (-) Transcript_7995:125-1180(-)